jgi:glycosyltransferase involved in cell wall biosynthesis
MSGRRELKLLFLLPSPPRRDATHGGGQAMASLLAGLAGRHQLGLIYLRASDEPPLDERLAAACAWHEEVARPRVVTTWRRRVRLAAALAAGRPMWATDWRVSAFGRAVRRRSEEWRPDVVQAEYQVMGQYLAPMPGRPYRVVTVHEPGAMAAWEAQAARQGVGRALHLADYLAWRRFEPRVLRRADRIVVFTERDGRTIAPLAPRVPVVCIPLGLRLPEAALSPEGSEPMVLFVGSFRHPPNVEAAVRLARAIYPPLRARYPAARLTIVGEEAPAALFALAGDGVDVTGRVPDVRPYLNRAAVVAVPLRTGGGMRVKVLEALGYGKAVVASRLAVEGLAVEDGREVALAEDDQQFTAAIGQLLADPEGRRRLAKNARSWASRHLGPEAPVSQYEELYAGLLQGAGGEQR